MSNYYWYFKSALTPRFCDEVIKYALSKKEVLDLKRKRNSDLVWLDDTWIYKELHPYVFKANKNAG